MTEDEMAKAALIIVVGFIFWALWTVIKILDN